MTSIFDVVVATDLKRGIGKGGQLPWRLSGDMKYFKELTTARNSPEGKNALVMGRKTWESIPPKRRPLPERLNVVITRDDKYSLPDGVLSASSLDDALAKLEREGVDKTFVIGGGEIYRLAVEHPACRYIYLTEVRAVFDCDTFFPDLGEKFSLLSNSELQEEDGIEYAFMTYQPSRSK